MALQKLHVIARGVLNSLVAVMNDRTVSAMVRGAPVSRLQGISESDQGHGSLQRSGQVPAYSRSERRAVSRANLAGARLSRRAILPEQPQLLHHPLDSPLSDGLALPLSSLLEANLSGDAFVAEAGPGSSHVLDGFAKLDFFLPDGSPVEAAPWDSENTAELGRLDLGPGLLNVTHQRLSLLLLGMGRRASVPRGSMPF